VAHAPLGGRVGRRDPIGTRSQQVPGHYSVRPSRPDRPPESKGRHMHAAALDQRGAMLATKGFPTTTPGYRELLDWLCAFGEVDVVAVESTGSYAAALVRYLREHGVRVLEVNQPHAHTGRRRGKSDPI